MRRLLALTETPQALGEAIRKRAQAPGISITIGAEHDDPRLEDFTVVTFARWEEGLVVAEGNPKGVRAVDDLARKKVRFVNREPGSGSRGLLDKLLDSGDPDAIGATTRSGSFQPSCSTVS